MESDFRLGVWLVEPNLNRLSANGNMVHLEPKVMRVLVCLAETGAVISKEKLITTIWADTFVTEDVLTRSISELRKAFADNARNPKYIETIPKNGYRLMVPVSREIANVNETQNLAPAALVRAMPAPAPEPATPRQLRLRVAIAALLSLAAGIVLTASYASYLARRSARPGPQVPPGRIMLAVMPFQNLSSDPQQDYFADGLTAEMISQLGRQPSDQLGVVAWHSIIHYKGVQASEDEVSSTLGANYILEGTVRRAGNHVRITAELVQIGQRIHVWANSYDGELGDVLDVQNRVAREIARDIQLHFRPEQGPLQKTIYVRFRRARPGPLKLNTRAQEM